MTGSALPNSVDAMLELLSSRGYVAERSLATVTYLSLRMGRPLFLEGEAGVGKTEIAKVLAAGLGRKLIRLQCYEGLDAASAVYERNSAAQMIAIRLAEAVGPFQGYPENEQPFLEVVGMHRDSVAAINKNLIPTSLYDGAWACWNGAKSGRSLAC